MRIVINHDLKSIVSLWMRHEYKNKLAEQLEEIKEVINKYKKYTYGEIISGDEDIKECIKELILNHI